MGGATSLNGGAFLKEGKSFWDRFPLFNYTQIVPAYSWVEERLVAPLPISKYGEARKKACIEAGYGSDNGYQFEYVKGAQQLYSTFVKERNSDVFHRRVSDWRNDT